MNLGTLQRITYLAQRDLGDADALRRGPDVYARRIARRTLTRELFRTLSRWGR